MSPNDFEARMREGEFFHSLRLLRGAWCVLRVDGRGFSRFTESPRSSASAMSLRCRASRLRALGHRSLLTCTCVAAKRSR